jgi:hypothetical protein
MKITLKDIGSFELYDKITHAIVGPMENLTMIDLCCCEATMTRNYLFKEKTYIDVLDCWEIPGQMDRFVQADVLGDHPVFDKHYDVAICSDGIEHLSKEDGLKLVERMKAISDKQIIMTPLGCYLVDENGTDPRGHKSGWQPEEFEGFNSVVFPQYHPTLGENGLGAFWVWRSNDMDTEMMRVQKAFKK